MRVGNGNRTGAEKQVEKYEKTPLAEAGGVFAHDPGCGNEPLGFFVEIVRIDGKRIVCVDGLRRRILVPAIRFLRRQSCCAVVYGIGDDLDDIRIVVDRECLVARREVENLTGAALESHAAAEDVSAFIPRQENDVRFRRNSEGLAIHFGVRDDEGIGKSFGDGVLLIDNPNALLFADFAPTQRAGSTEHAAKDFGVVSGVQNDQAHAFQDPFLDLVDDGIGDAIVGTMSPPDEDVRCRENVIGQTVFRLIEGGQTNLEIVCGDIFGNCPVNAIGIEGTNEFTESALAFFVKEFIPNGNTNFVHI